MFSRSPQVRSHRGWDICRGWDNCRGWTTTTTHPTNASSVVSHTAHTRCGILANILQDEPNARYKLSFKHVAGGQVFNMGREKQLVASYKCIYSFDAGQSRRSWKTSQICNNSQPYAHAPLAMNAEHLILRSRFSFARVNSPNRRSPLVRPAGTNVVKCNRAAWDAAGSPGG